MKKRYLILCLLLLLPSFAFKSNNGSTTAIPKTEETLLSDWIALQLKLVRTTKGLSQGMLFRYFGYSSVAFYESIVASDKSYQSLASQLQGLERLPEFKGDKKTCWTASGNAAMAAMLRTFYEANPAGVRAIDSLENRYAEIIKKDGYTSANIDAAVAYGKSVAAAILEWSKNDGASTKYPAYEIPKGDGLWEPTPPAFSAPAAPYAYRNRTCLKNSTENTLPKKPLEFSADANSKFYSMVNDVYIASQNLTEAQKAMALFWDDFPDGRYYGAAGHWASIFRQVATSQKLSLTDGAAAYVVMNIALMDAFNACWKAKYTYNLLRPVTYVQKHMGHQDWTPLIITPSHPEYPAAHASLSMAAATALTHVLGNNIAFTDHSYDDLGFTARSFNNFEEAGREAGLSRFYGGIHYKPSIEAGYVLGATTAENIRKELHIRK
jgi:hypothetical protein